LRWIAQNSTALITLATVIYTVLTALIWYATQQNTTATRQVLEASQRPYVGVTVVEIMQVYASSRLCASIQNVGTVPSRNVEINFRLTVNGKLLKELESGRLALLSNQKHTLCCEIGDEEIQLLRTSNQVEVTLKIGYQGMTKKRYRTETRCAYTDPSKPFQVTSAALE
jgi:hypothetical protein